MENKSEQTQSRGLLKKPLAWIAEYLAVEAWRSYVGPTVVPIVTGLLGWVQGLPLMYIWLGALLAWAATMHGLVKFSDWQFQRTAEHKFVFASPLVATNIDPDTGDVEGVNLGATFKNKALFPISLEVVSINTEVDGRVNPDPQLEKRTYVVDAESKFFLYDDAIPMPDLEEEGFFRGSVELTVRYGKGSKRQYSLDRHFDVHLLLEDSRFRVTNFYETTT